MKNNFKVVSLNKKRDSELGRINLKTILSLAKEDNIDLVKEIIEKNKLNGDELCLLAENAARNENVELIKWIISARNEVLYCYMCDILDITISTCNIQLIETVISQYDDAYTPVLKYRWTLDRVIANDRSDILKILKDRKINTEINVFI